LPKQKGRSTKAGGRKNKKGRENPTFHNALRHFAGTSVVNRGSAFPRRGSSRQI
jgi:hypothetical protein